MEDSMMPSLSRKKWFPTMAVMLAVSFVGADMTIRIGLSGGMAWAQDDEGPRRLALFVVPRTRDDATAALILKGLLRGTADRMVGAGLVRASTSPVEDPGAVATVRERVEEGRKFMNTGNWTQALGAFMDAEINLRKCMGLAGRVLVARVYKGVGLSLANSDKVDSGKKAVRRSLIVYPNQQVNEYAYNLESRKLFSKVLRSIQDAPNGSLVVDAGTAAEVYVDFEFRGFSPVRISGLPAGEHLVTIFSDGKRLYSRFTAVKGGADDNLDPVLVSAPGASEISGTVNTISSAVSRNGDVSDKSERLAEITGATDVLLLVVSGTGDGFDLQGIHFGSSGITPLEKTLTRDATLVLSAQEVLTEAIGLDLPAEVALGPLDSPTAAIPGIAAEGTGTVEGGEELILDPDSPIFKDTVQKDEKIDIVREWWFWTAIGAILAVGLGVGLGVGLNQGGDAGPMNSGDIGITIHGAQ